MRGTKEHHAVCRKEYHSVSWFIFGGLLCELKSLCESKSGSVIHPKPNTHIFYHKPPETMGDEYNRARVLIERLIIGDLIGLGYASNLVSFFPASPQIRD